MHLTKEHPLFVRAELINKSFDFFSKEDELKYIKDKKRIGPSWEYANKKVNFKFNKSGYRCPVNYDELKEGFLLTMGCSYTEGIGLAEEDTYTYRLAKKLNLIDNYYNAGIGGFGVDAPCTLCEHLA